MSHSIHETAMRLLTKIKQQSATIGLVSFRKDDSLAYSGGLALGGKILPLHSADEMDEFLKSVQAIVLDTSAVHFLEQKALLLLMAQIKKRKMPWVFVPSDVEYYAARREISKIILARKPTAICAREAEITALSPQQGGVANILRRFAKDYTDLPRLILGKSNDHIIDNGKHFLVSGVDDILSRVNSNNLLQAIVVSHFLVASEGNTAESLPSAALTVKSAVRRAVSVTNGPGSFIPVFIDAFYHLKRDYLYQITVQQGTDFALQNQMQQDQTTKQEEQEKEVLFM